MNLCREYHDYYDQNVLKQIIETESCSREGNKWRIHPSPCESSVNSRFVKLPKNIAQEIKLRPGTNYNKCLYKDKSDYLLFQKAFDNMLDFAEKDSWRSAPEVVELTSLRETIRDETKKENAMLGRMRTIEWRDQREQARKQRLSTQSTWGYGLGFFGGLAYIFGDQLSTTY